MKVKITLVLDIDDSNDPISPAELDEAVTNMDVNIDSDVLKITEVTVESYTVINP
jgi:hypothetical protein